MASKPKYYYDLSIYDPEETKDSRPSPPLSTPYFSFGIGQKVIGLFSSTKMVGQNLTNKGKDLVEYVSTTEGKIKVSLIGSSTCVGLLLAAVSKSPSRYKKLLYPTGLLALSSAVCYPHAAYSMSKKAALATYDVSVRGGTVLYNGSVWTKNKIGDYTDERRKKAEEAKAEEEANQAPLDLEIFSAKEDKDTAPIMNLPVEDKPSFDNTETNLEATKDFLVFTSKSLKEQDADSRKSNSSDLNTVVDEVKGSLVDMGQSLDEDTDMYSTRS